MFIEQQFAIPKLRGITEKTIEEHKKLYAGYVKNANMITELLEKGAWEGDGGIYSKNELHRRLSFEFNGMRNHECYFKLLEGENALSPESSLALAINAQWQSLEAFTNAFSALALTRGIGWAMLSWDQQSKQLIMHWVDEQHLGHLLGTEPVIALDMWEHSYVADYFPSGKKQYIADFMDQLNWKQAQANFEAAVHSS